MNIKCPACGECDERFLTKQGTYWYSDRNQGTYYWCQNCDNEFTQPLDERR